MSNDHRTKLGDVACVTSGYAFKSSEFQVDGIPAIKIKNVRVGNVDLTEADHVSEDNAALPERYHSLPGDILISLTGSHITQPNSVVGRVARHSWTLPPCLINQRVGKITVKDPRKVDKSYLFYALNNLQTMRSIASLAHGAASQANVSPKQVESIEIYLPPIGTQGRVASILSAYDDLIEVNRRRIAVLEQMARGIFEEWFVRFRFPGHETVPLLDTPDGPLPEGWSFETISKVSSFLSRGIAPKYDDSSATLVIGQKCIRNGRLSLTLGRYQSRIPPPAKIVQAGDILINSTGVGTLGRVAQAEQVPPGLTADSHVTIVRPSQEEDRDYLGLLMLKLEPVFEHLGAGSTGQTELSRNAVGNQTIIWPPSNLRITFGRLARPMRTLVVELMKQNERLAASHDLLLPRLISGQLSLTQAERELEEAA